MLLQPHVGQGQHPPVFGTRRTPFVKVPLFTLGKQFLVSTVLLISETF